MEDVLGEAAQEEIDALISKCDFIGLMVDESIDVAIHKKMILYLKIVMNGKPKILFGGNVEVSDGKANTITAAILKYMTDHNISFDKLIGFASDGANTMVGRLNGVSTQLKNMNPWIVSVHCAAHKLALAAFHGAKTMPYLLEMQRTINSVYYFFKYSPTRYQKIRELQAVLGKKVKKFKKPSNVRWLSISEAVDALYGSWGVLIMTLEHEIETNGTSEARGILNKVNNFKFLASLAMLHDVLTVISKLSKVFQKDNIDIDQMNGMITSTKLTLETFINNPGQVLGETLDMIEQTGGQFHGVKVTGINDKQKRDFNSLKKKYIENVISKINERFQPDQLDLLQCLNTVLNPKVMPNTRDDILLHGCDQLNQLIHHYGSEQIVNGTLHPPLIVGNRARNDFLQFKFLVNSKKHLSLADFVQLVLNDYAEEFPDFHVLANVLSVIPLTSVPCERGFSMQNRIKSKSRNRIGIDRVEIKMKIAYVVRNVDGSKRKMIESATNSFISKMKRRKNNYQ